MSFFPDPPKKTPRITYSVYEISSDIDQLANTYTHTLPILSMYGILTYIYHTNQLNVGKYTSPMDGMGYIKVSKRL